jgi:N-methylhydantoinase B
MRLRRLPGRFYDLEDVVVLVGRLVIRGTWRACGSCRTPAGQAGGGGLASERVLEVAADSIVVSEFADRTETRPWGLFGGLPGTSAATLVRRAGDDRFGTFGEVFGTVSNTKFSGIVLRCGDQVVIRTAGGGGYGDPAVRPAELVRDDVENGLVGADTAERLYGRAPVGSRG